MRTDVITIEQASDHLLTATNTGHVCLRGKALDDQMEIKHVRRNGNTWVCVQSTAVFDMDVFEDSGVEALSEANYGGMYTVLVPSQYIADGVLANLSESDVE
jgi:hypothetical protein